MEFEKVAGKLRPLMPESVDHWKRVWESGSPRLRSLIERTVLNEAYRRLGPGFQHKPLLSLPPEQRAKGAIHLGTVVYENEKWPAGLQLPEFLQHVGIYGRSGAGKTNLAFHLIRQLSQRGIPWLFLDWKRTARHLLPRVSKRVQVYTPGRQLSPMLFNPFVPPPGIEKHLYINHLIDFFASAYTLGDGARRLLQRAISACYEELDGWPTVHDVLQCLERIEAKGRAGQWKVSALRALESLAFAKTTDGHSTNQESLVKQLAHGKTIVELDGLSTSEKKLIVPSILFWLYSYFLSQDQRENLRLVIFVEEAHHVFYRQEQRARETVMDMVMRQCRELGIGIVIVDQHPHLISSAALGNSFATIGMNMREPSDVNKAAALLGMGEDETRYLRSLGVGQGVVRLQGRWQDPFLIQIPHVPIEKGKVSDEVLLKYLEKPHASVSNSLRSKAGNADIWQVPGIPLDDNILSQGALAFLEYVLVFREDGVKERYARLGLSARRGTALKQDLVERGWLDQEVIKLGRTRKTLLRLSKAAREALGMESGPKSESLAHEYWKHWYARFLTDRGYKTRIEAARAGGRVDVLARKGDELLGVEIETGKSDVVSNVKNGLLTGFTKVLIVATDESAFSIVQTKLAKAGLFIPKRVRVVRCGNY